MNNSMSYAVDDGDGNEITCGLSEQRAWKIAQDIADRRGETVYLYQENAPANEWTPVPPTPKAID